jgi:regulatory protein YycH of two-component signal transduction system YycFG
MSAIQASLQNLQKVIKNLEKSMVQFEQKRIGEQRDMFAVSEGGKDGAGSFSNELIAKRLDSAIEKVEKILASDSSKAA